MNSALIDDLERQFAENPRRVFARLANEYRKSGELDRAIEICQVHVPQQPGYISGYIVMGQALFESGRLDEAHATFQTALDLDPENLIALRHLGDIAVRSGDPDGARVWYQRLLEIDPQNEEIAAQLEQLTAPENEVLASAPAPVDVEEVSGWGNIQPEEPAAAAVVEEAPPEAEEDAEVALERALPEMATEEPVAAEEELSGMDEIHVFTGESHFDNEEHSTFATADASPGDHDFAPGDIVAQGDPFDRKEDTEAASIAHLSLEGESVVEISALDAGVHEPIALELPDAAARQEQDERDATPPPVAAEAPLTTDSPAASYTEQGYREEAVDIFRRMAAEESSSSPAAEARQDDPTAAAPTRRSPETTIRSFLASLAGRRPPRRHVEAARPSTGGPSSGNGLAGDESGPSLFGSALVSHADETAAAVLAAAFSEDYLDKSRDSRGQPTRAAADELSLDDVFRDARAREDDARSGRAVSFDEFFAPRAGEAAPRSEAGNNEEPASKPSSDLELFHAWLEGLKK